MAYEKTNWLSGDVITAEKLNHMEDGIAGSGGGKVITVHDNENHILDMTFQEIADAFSNNVVQLIVNYEGVYSRYVPFMLGQSANDPEYPYHIYFTSIETVFPGMETVTQYHCTNTTDYPSLVTGTSQY